MWILFKREVESIAVWLLFLSVVMGIIILVMIKDFFGDLETVPVGLSVYFFKPVRVSLSVLPLISAAIGVGQIFKDRRDGVSKFLCTLAVSRNRIMATRILAGVVGISLIIASVILVELVLLMMYRPVVPVDWSPFMSMWLTVFLVNLSAYALGLSQGWKSNRFVRAIGILVIGFVVVGVIMIKGYDLTGWLLLVLIAVAGFVVTFQQYTKTSL